MAMADDFNRPTKQTVKELREGVVVKGKFAIRSKETPREYKSREGRYFFLTVGDLTGNIPVKYWGGLDAKNTIELYNTLSVGDVVELTGTAAMDKFENRLVITMNEDSDRLRKCDESEYNIDEFLPVTKRDMGEMMEAIIRVIDTVKEPHLNRLLHAFFDDNDFVISYKFAPSAMIHHHNYVGGHLEHTLGTVKLCDTICNSYEDLDRDLLITGAILHDIGKIFSYMCTTSVDMTDKGRFIGHIVLGDRMIREKINTLEDFPEDLYMQLAHIVLSHHGDAERGIPKRIKTAEACALHFADNFDAQVKEFIQAIEEGRIEAETQEDVWGYIRTIGREVYLK